MDQDHTTPSGGPQACFSICIPVYNGRRYLAETLASIRAQTWPHWELIVAEDGSPEPVRDLVEAFATTVPQRVTYVAAPMNIGTAATRDLAMDRAAQPLIAVLDADDLWQPEHLATHAACYADLSCEFAFSGFTMFTGDPREPDGLYVPTQHHLADLRAAYFFCRNWMPTGAITFRRSILEKTGPWALGLEDKPDWLPNRNFSEDRNFLLRVVHQGITPVWTGQVTFGYRKHSTSTTGFTESGLVERAWFYNYYGLAEGIPPHAQRKFFGYLHRMAGDHLLACDPRHASWFYFRAWRWWPWRIDRLGRAGLAMLQSFTKS